MKARAWRRRAVSLIEALSRRPGRPAAPLADRAGITVTRQGAADDITAMLITTALAYCASPAAFPGFRRFAEDTAVIPGICRLYAGMSPEVLAGCLHEIRAGHDTGDAAGE